MNLQKKRKLINFKMFMIEIKLKLDLNVSNTITLDEISL